MRNMNAMVVLLLLATVVDRSSTAPVAGSYLADAPPHVPRIGRRSEAPQEGRLPLTHAETVYYLLPRHYPRVGRSDPSVPWHSSRNAQYRSEDLLSLLQLGDAYYGAAPLPQPTGSTDPLYRASAQNGEQDDAGESELEDLYDDRPLEDDAMKRDGQSTAFYDRTLFQDDSDRADGVRSPPAAEGPTQLGEPLLTCEGAECALPRGLLRAIVRSLVQRATSNTRLQRMLREGSRRRERQLRRLW